MSGHHVESQSDATFSKIAIFGYIDSIVCKQIGKIVAIILYHNYSVRKWWKHVETNAIIIS
jgi:hypothetical protein